MPEGDLPTSQSAGNGEAGQQENGHAANGPPPPWSHTWYEEVPRKRRKRRDRTNGQNGRAGPSVPRGGSRVEGDDDSSDEEVDVPYKQVWVSFLYNENTYRKDKYGNPMLGVPAQPTASASTSKSKRAGSKQPESTGSKNSKRSDPVSSTLHRAATTNQGHDEEDDFRILEEGEDRWASRKWHVSEQENSRRSTPSAHTGETSSRRTSTPGSAQPTPPPASKEGAPTTGPPVIARLHRADFFPLGRPDIYQMRREQEELVRQFFYRRPNYSEMLESGMTPRSTRSDEEWEREIGLKLGVGPYPNKGPRTDVVLGENGWYKYIGQLGEEAKGSPINLRVKAFERMVKAWEGCFAVCGGQRITVFKAIPTKGVRLLWQHVIQDDELWDLAWSYDEIVHQPLIAAAGASGLIYIISPAERQTRRILKGHGGPILNVRFSPNDPHILSTTSNDKTVRFWNIFGEDVDDPSTRVPQPAYDPEVAPPTTSQAAIAPSIKDAESPVAVKAEPTGARNHHGDRILATYENLSDRYGKTKLAYSGPDPANDSLSRAYALGQADEGKACYAIIAGEGPAGHRWSASAVAFHPNHRAVVTGSHDYYIRIWALPESPEIPEPGSNVRTPLGYHPPLISIPLFASNRIHEGGIDCIDWLTDDILISKTSATMVVWQWLGYRRFFTEDEYGTDRLPQMTDWKNSHSFRIIAKYHFMEGAFWYKRFGLHQAWGDQDESLNPYGQTSGALMACVDGDTTPPQILLFNMKHIEYPKKLVPPRFIRNTIWHGVDCDGCEEEPQHGMEVDGEPTDCVTPASSPIPMSKELPIKVDDSPSNRATAELPETEEYEPDGYIPRMRAYMLPTLGLAQAKQNAAKTHNKPIDHSPANLECVAISPRGARWIVGVGTSGAIVVFELQAAGEDGEDWTDGSDTDDESLITLSDEDEEA